MEELTILFVVLFIVLGIVTLVGHGIWVLLARIFGGPRRPTAATRNSRSTLDPTRPQCPQCGASMARGQSTCAVCNWTRASAQPTDGMEALRAIRRQLEVFSQQGSLDPEARAQLNAVINEQEQRLIGQLCVPADGEPVTELLAAAPIPPAEAVTPSETAVSDVATSAPTAEPQVGETLWLKDELKVTHPAAPLPDRARKYAASRAAAATFVASEELAPPPPPREPIARLFAAFMEEKNIRWGELVGGLLIVGCSIALVISFWSQIATRPLLKFGLFNGVTAALFGMGLYTDRRWKIHTTSHGILAIATLLVPLNFLAIAAFTQASPPTDLLSLAGEGLSLTIFALFTYFAGRILEQLTFIHSRRLCKHHS